MYNNEIYINRNLGGVNKDEGNRNAAIGAGAGFIVANTGQTDLTTTLILVGLGSISALIPDLDVDGKLRNKITLSHEIVKWAAQIIGILLAYL